MSEEKEVSLIAAPMNAAQYPLIFFVGNPSKEMIKLCPNGDIYVKEKLIENDQELVDGLREWFAGVRRT